MPHLAPDNAAHGPSHEPTSDAPASDTDPVSSVSSPTPSELESVKERLQEIPSAKEPINGHSLRGRIKQRIAALTKRIGTRQILRLFVYRKGVRRAITTIPRRMQLVTNQARLVLELIDDFLEGKYRDIPWHSVAVASGALVYSVSPADVVPDFLPLVGSLDDMAVISIAMRWIEKDLRAYCAFKGYDPEDYFPSTSTEVEASGEPSSSKAGPPTVPGE